MEYIGVAEAAKKWGISERSVREYCAQGRVAGAFVLGKSWAIPAEAAKPVRRRASLLSALAEEMAGRVSGGIYHRVQVDLTYNSNHIEGSKLTHDQTRLIFETKTIGLQGTLPTDDIIETVNHFRCVDRMIATATRTLTPAYIKQLHLTLKSGTSDSEQAWFKVGDYKAYPNEVGGSVTSAPECVAADINALLEAYNAQNRHTFEDIVGFHARFEAIHPFQDGNGRVGRLAMFKECLKNAVTPFIIDEDLKLYYYRGLREWQNDRRYLIDTCLAAQDKFKALLDYFRIPYAD